MTKAKTRCHGAGRTTREGKALIVGPQHSAVWPACTPEGAKKARCAHSPAPTVGAAAGAAASSATAYTGDAVGQALPQALLCGLDVLV